MTITMPLFTAFLLILTITQATVAATTTPAPSSSLKPNQRYELSVTLYRLGFRDLAAAAAAANISPSLPTTIFAPADSSLRTCPSCSLPLLLQEHSLKGLYPLHYIRRLAFGTKIETYATNHCLTITASPATAPTPTTVPKVFISGVEITKPDLFNNGQIIVHALQGFVSHLSPTSCNIEYMNSLSFPPQQPPMAMFFSRQIMIKSAMTQLRSAGYTIAALAMCVQYTGLADLNNMTLFAVDDESIFRDSISGRKYVAEIAYHVVPNMLLRAPDLIELPEGTSLPTMKPNQKLVVTTAGGRGPLLPMRINYQKIEKFDIVQNFRIAVHKLPKPFHSLSTNCRRSLDIN